MLYVDSAYGRYELGERRGGGGVGEDMRWFDDGVVCGVWCLYVPH